MKKLTLPLALLTAAVLTACGGGSNSNNTTPTVSAFSVAVTGDMPYGTTATDTTQTALLPNYIANINAAKVDLVLHGGDIHSGKQYCTAAYDTAIYQQYATYTAPLIYTPGDNEWADCHKSGEGGGSYNATTGQITYVTDTSGALVDYAGGDPVANLALVRSTFFSRPGQTIGGSMTVHTQAQEYDNAHPTDAQFVENVWMVKSGVLFLAVNIPGGSNNGTDPWYGAPSMSPAQQQEVANRTAAALRWIDTGFAQAATAGASAVVLLVQADMWDLDGKAATHIAEYKQYIDRIASHTTNFGKPVLLINGDSHVFRSDNPLVPSAPCLTEDTSTGAAGLATKACTDDAYASQPNGYSVPNFRRVVFHGSTLPQEWLKLAVDPSKNAANGTGAFGPFSWSRVAIQ